MANVPAWTILVSVDKVVISETDGTKTIAQAKDVFTGYIDPRFKNQEIDKPSASTSSQTLNIYEMRENATFKQMFNSLGVDDRDTLCLTQAQIIELCKKHRDKLHPTDWATFFLFKVGDEYSVAFVYANGRGLEARALYFDDSLVWCADYRQRVVLPQLRSSTREL